MLKHIYRVDLDLTGLCNRRCVFCPRADDSYPNENKHMSFEVIEEVIKQLRKIGFQSWIELAGRGEPTLHPQFLKIVDMLSKDAWKLRLTTNGYKMHKWDGPMNFPYVITIFSAPNYCGYYENKAAVLMM